ncbi:MAG: DMT family transporter [Lachnospiraceae bacterium]|nr:DMT family transporter [Lachnospiraceae bacterium]
MNDKKTSIHTERAKYITAVVLYGTIGMLLRSVDYPSEIVALCRGTIGSVFIILFLRTRHRGLDFDAIRRNILWLVLSGICLGSNWIFLFAAYTHTTVAIASLCNYMAPVMVILVAPVLIREPLNKRKLPCIAVALLGIILVSGVWNGAVGNMLGVVMGLAAAVCFVFIVVCNRKLKDISAYDRSVIQLAISALTILPYVIVRNRGAVMTWDTKSVLIILMLGLVHTGVAYCLYFSGLGSLPVQTVAILGYLEPVVSVLCSALLLREPLGLAGWAGAVLILGAAVVSELIE